MDEKNQPAEYQDSRENTPKTPANTANDAFYNSLLNSNEITYLLFEMGLCSKIYFSPDNVEQIEKYVKQKRPLPPKIKKDATGYYQVKVPNMDEKALQTYLMLKQTSYLKSLKSNVMFFYVLKIISIVLSILIPIIVGLFAISGVFQLFDSLSRWF